VAEEDPQQLNQRIRELKAALEGKTQEAKRLRSDNDTLTASLKQWSCTFCAARALSAGASSAVLPPACAANYPCGHLLCQSCVDDPPDSCMACAQGGVTDMDVEAMSLLGLRADGTIRSSTGEEGVSE